MLLPFGTPELWQRIYATKDLKTAKRSVLLSGLFYIVGGLILSWLGLIIRQTLNNIDPDTVLIQGLTTLLPVGLVGIGIIALFSAVMSSADTYLFTNTSILIQDLYGKIKNLDQERIVKSIRFGLFIIMVFGFILALTFPNLVGITFITGGLGLGMSIIVLSTWIFRKISKIALVFGMILGMLSVIYSSLTQEITPTIAAIGIFGSITGLILGGIINKIRKLVSKY
jgi:Na+/proline symporter